MKAQNLTLSEPNSILLNKYYLHTFRFLLIVLISLVITHLLSYNRLPFSPGYSFPTQTFLVAVLFGSTICTANWFIYHLISFPEKFDNYWKQLTARMGIQLVFTVIFYTLLYVAVILLWFGASFNAAHYLKFLLICSSIIGTEFLVFELIKMHQRTITYDASHLYIPTMTKDVRLPYSSINMLHSVNGIVTLYSKEHNPLITKHSSLEELEKVVPNNLFYRVNRQYLLNRDVIRTVERNANRTLDILLDVDDQRTAESIRISRYKRKEFLEWLQGNS